VLKTLAIDPVIIKSVTCPTCYALYDFDTSLVRCQQPNLNTVGQPPCNTELRSDKGVARRV
jgi:hypothetical protein